MTLTAEQVTTFHSAGFVSGIRVLDTPEVQMLNRRVCEFATNRPRDAAWAFDIKCNLLFDWVYDVCASPRMLAAVEPLLGPDLFATNAVFRNKQPGTDEQYGWHQDDARIQVDPCFVIAFLALSDHTTENGCLQVIPGSHGTVHGFEVITNPVGQSHRKVARTRDVDPKSAMPIELAAGEAVIFSGSTVHGSGPNRSTSERGALLIDYTAACARQSVGQGSGQLVAGTDTHGHCAHEFIPEGDCTPRDVLRRRDILNRYPQNPLMGPLPKDGTIEFPDAPDT